MRKDDGFIYRVICKKAGERQDLWNESMETVPHAAR